MENLNKFLSLYNIIRSEEDLNNILAREKSKIFSETLGELIG